MWNFYFKASREQLHERDGFIWLLGWLQATLERLKFHNWDPNGMPLYSLAGSWLLVAGCYACLLAWLECDSITLH